MNSVVLIGRLTRDPEIRRNGETVVANFTLAIARPVKAGAKKKTDFPRIILFGKQAENCEKYLAKGWLAAVQGRIQTGSYTNRDGQTVYTTDVIGDRIEFLEWGDKQTQQTQQTQQAQADIPEGFQTMSNDDMPF